VKKIDWSVVLAILGAFVLLVVLFALHPFSCLSAQK